MDAARDVPVWRVAFYGDPKGWERAIIRPGFRHCSAFAWASEGVWLEIDANLTRIETRILPHAAYVQRLVDLQISGATFVDVETRAGAAYRWSPTCAGIIAGVLGVKGALRPQQLYRILTTSHRRSLWARHRDHQAQRATTKS